MQRLVTSLDQHGRMLIPSHIREMFKIHPGEKVTLEISQNEIKIINNSQMIDEIHSIFTKNQNDRNISTTDDFINKKRQEYIIEKTRDNKNV
ncbi:MAG: AbrB/MazE/SpoVT family DNA-binding domain-containing protein [Pseudomonadota bacterium]